MELEKCGDGDHSTEMLSALKRFEDVCNSLEDEHTKLLELEKRRQKLNEDLERLRNEIKEEKDYFRSAIDEPFAEELDKASNEPVTDLVEPMSLDTGAIKEFIKVQREELASQGQDLDIERLKENLKQYQDTYIDGIERQTQEAISASVDFDPESSLDDAPVNELRHDETAMIHNPADGPGEDYIEYLTSDEE